MKNIFAKIFKKENKGNNEREMLMDKNHEIAVCEKAILETKAFIVDNTDEELITMAKEWLDFWINRKMEIETTKVV